MGKAMDRRSSQQGFTLVELMVAVVILGIALTSMSSLYLGMQRTSSNQEEVVDIQQSLRVALDSMSKDIKMAGLLIPVANSGVTAGSDATTLNIATASTYYTFARLGANVDVAAGTTSAVVFPVAEAGMADRFKAGDKVRVIRPQSGDQPANQDLEVVSTFHGDADYPTNPAAAPPTITLKDFPATEAQYFPGDIIARVTGGVGTPDPSTVTWTLDGTNLVRNADAQGNDVMAENVTQLEFDYQLNDGTETSTPAASDLTKIEAIRVTVTADTTHQLDGQTRKRSLVSLVRLRN